MFILPIIHALLCTTYAWALGINCRGLCDDSAKGYATALNSAIKTKIDNDTWYNNGDHVSCVPDQPLCAFLQYIPQGGAVGKTIKELSSAIIGHGCEGCGSAPLDGQDIRNGELTFNIVSHNTCGGTCVQTGY